VVLFLVEVLKNKGDLKMIEGMPEGWELVRIGRMTKGEWAVGGNGEPFEYTRDKPGDEHWPVIRKVEPGRMANSRTVVEEELMIEVERLRAWLKKIQTEAYKEKKPAVLEWLAEQSLIRSHCVTHPDWKVTEDWAKLGVWPPISVAAKEVNIAG